MQDYRMGEKAAGISSLFSCRIGRTPVWGGYRPPGLRDASRTRARSLRSLYTQVCTNVFSPPSSLVQQAARGENCSRASMALPHPSSTFGISPGAEVRGVSCGGASPRHVLGDKGMITGNARHHPAAAESSGVRRRRVGAAWLISSEGWVWSSCRQRWQRRLCRRSQL
jgi:hypothetical protein